MLLILLITVAAVAIVWLEEALLAWRRAGVRFVYNHDGDPAGLTGIVAGDATAKVYGGDPEQWPRVVVIVPGRNEGHVLADTLGSLCRMDYPNYRIVFVDDQSTDNTAEVCAQLQNEFKHLHVIHNTTPPPDGWVGKVWAIHQAKSEIGNGDRNEAAYVLFTDSDLKYHPACLRQMMRLALHRQTDLLSLLPAMECHSMGERLGLLAGMKLITTVFPLGRSNDPKTPAALTAGGFLLFRRAAYEAIGGHEAVRKQVVEDIALGKLTKGKGFSIFTVATKDLMTGRMYEGWSDTYHGLKKNAYAGCNYNFALFAAGVLGMFLAGVMLPVYPILGLIAWLMAPSALTETILALSLLAFVAMVIDMTRCVRFLNFPAYCAWLTPISVLFVIIIFTHSMFDHYFGGNVWSGRRYKPEHVEALAEAGQERG